MIRYFRDVVAVALALSLWVPAASAATESGRFTLSVAGIRAGTLAYEGTVTGDQYVARGSARASGLVGAIFDAEADAAAQGRVTGNRYRPQTASENVREGRDKFRKEYRFTGAGTPTVTRTPPRKKPRKHAADAASQRGVIDPMTAAFAILRNQTDETVCKLDIASFDGARRSRLRLGQAAATDRGLICRGDYIREAGFSPREMSERVVWPVTLEYERMSDGVLRVRELRFPTSIGNARLRRRD